MTSLPNRAKIPFAAGNGTTQAPWRVWLRAIRIFSFTASVVPVLVATGLAMYEGGFDLIRFLLLLVASVACHAGANLANDYFDHLKGIDNAESLGPSKVIQEGLLTAAQVRRGMIVSFGLATVLGLIIVYLAGWPILVLGLASLAAAYFYTGGPKPLGYIALGEVTVFFFMGPVLIGGSYYVYTEHVSKLAIVASLPIAALVTAILHANNIRDIEPDRAAGKTTLAVLLGREGSSLEYFFLVIGAYLITVAIPVMKPGLLPVLVAFVTLPRAIILVRAMRDADNDRTLNRLVRLTAGLHLRFGAFFTIGLFASAIIDWLVG